MLARIQRKLTLGFHVDHQAREIFEKGRGRATRGKSNGSPAEKVFCRFKFLVHFSERKLIIAAVPTIRCIAENNPNIFGSTAGNRVLAQGPRW